MATITFEQLPGAIESINTKIDSILAFMQSATLPPQAALDEPPLTVETAAVFLNCSRSSVYQKTSKNELPHSKRGGRCYFSKAELMQWIKDGKIKTNSEIQDEATQYAKRA